MPTTSWPAPPMTAPPPQRTAMLPPPTGRPRPVTATVRGRPVVLLRPTGRPMNRGSRRTERSSSPPARSAKREFAGGDQVVGDVPDLPVGVHRGSGQRLERLIGGQLVPLHEDALRLVDDCARLQ